MNPDESDLTPAERILDDARVLRGLRRGVREAMWLHKQLGQPAAIWKDGRVQWVPAEELPDLTTEDAREE